MADKIKEQVKYDPNLSPEKRMRKVRNDGQTLAVFIIVRSFLLIAILFFFGTWVIYPFKDILDSDRDMGMVMCGTYIFMFSFVCSIVGHTLLDPNIVKKQRATSKGCFNIGELYAVMPVTRLTVRKNNFNAFALWTLVPNMAYMILINVYSMIFSSFESLLGCIGGVSLAVNAMLVVLFLNTFGIKRLSEKVSAIKNTALIFIYLCWVWLPLIDPVIRFSKNSDLFRSIAGIPGLIISVAAAAFIICREKLFYQKKLVNAPWFE